MTDGNSLINLGEISKPATVLIKKISNAVGVLYEPRKIRNLAKAESDAERIKAIAGIELNEIQQRAMDRLAHQETRKQENIEAITTQAIASLPDDANVEGLEEDWIAYFFARCETVSDKDMQSLWSRLLAGEATKPSTFSKRTIDFVASMDKRDAQLFTDFCQFCWSIETRTVPFVFDISSDIFAANNIDFDDMEHMETIGLITFDTLVPYRFPNLMRSIEIKYFNSTVFIEFNKDCGNELTIGSAILTQVGEELETICGSKENREFFNFMVEAWTKQGLTIRVSD